MFELAGKTLGPYRILEQIGVGGMAMVYKAYQPNMDRYVAVKVLPSHLSQDPEFVKRFQREARVIARLEHARILPVHDYGEYKGVTYIVMRYVEAGTLKDRITAKRFSLDEINRIIGQIGGALDYAHRIGVIHRDVKPGNVLVDDQGDTYLTDFGLARMMEPTEKLTGSGVGLGTPAYMSPEQGQGDKVDHRSDIYSLGVILYEMVTGHVPYEAETPMAIVLKHINDELPLPRAIDPSVPPSIERVILKALAKAPADRYQTAGEMVQALVKATSEAGVRPEKESAPIQAKPALAREDISLVTRFQRTWERPRGKVALIGGGLFTIAALGFLLTWLLPSPVAIVSPRVTATMTTVVAATTSTIPPATPIVVEPAATLIATEAPASNGVLYFEDFEDGKADGLISTGAYWKVVSDEDGNQVYEVDTRLEPGGSTIEFGSYDWTDYAIEYRVKMLNPKADIWVNFRNSNQGRYIQRLSLKFDQVALFDSLGDVQWQPLTERGYNVEQGVWYQVRIEVQGETIRIYVDGDLKIEKTSSKISAGNVAIGNLGFTHALFDDILVTAPGEATNTLTIQARAFAEPILQAIADRPPDFEYDFSKLTSGWDTGSNQDSARDYVDGEYVVTVKPNHGTGAGPGKSFVFSDFVAEVDARIVSVTDPGGWGFIFREQSSPSPFRYHINFDNVGLSLFVDIGSYTDLFNLQGAPVRPAPETNHLLVIAKGPNIAVYVNDEPVTVVNDTTLSSGILSLGIHAGDQETEVHFDNFKIWDISNLP